MSAEVSGSEYRSGEYVPAGVLALVGLTGLGAWLMHGWLERRFGLAEWRALVWAGMPGAVAGGLVLLGVLRSRARMDAGQRLRAAMAAEPKRRRHRRWLVLVLGMLLLGQLADWPGFFASARGGGNWGLLVMVAAIVADGLRDVLPSGAATPAPDQAERSEALRAGFLAAVVLGWVCAAVALRWPGIAAQAWPSVLLASVLAAEVRMAMLPRWMGRVAGDAV